jgi:hypothetical protein
MKPFKVVVELETPVCLGAETFWTLDAVCHGIIEDFVQLGLADGELMDRIPLKQEEGLFLASKAMFKSDIETSLTKIGGIRPVRDMHDPEAFLERKRQTFAKVLTTRGPHKALLSRYTMIAARSVSWLAVGDPEAVVALIHNAGSIGALRKDGHGRIADVSYEVADDIDPLVSDGKPLRPIPRHHEAFSRVTQDAMIMTAAWRPSYFDIANRGVCAVPDV